MRFFFGVVFVLTTAIAIWLMTLTPSSPEPNASQPSPYAELPSEARNLNKQNIAKAESSMQVEEAKSRDDRIIEQALLRYPQVSAHELKDFFAKNPALKKVRVDLIIALIERGDMTADEWITNFGLWGPFTVAHSAVGNTPHDLTLEHFNKLIELGADVNGQKIWRMAMARQSNYDVVEKWYTHAALGPEVHDELIGNAITFGNTAIYKLVVTQLGARMTRKEDNAKFLAMMTTDVKESLAKSANVDSQAMPHDLIKTLQLRLRQAKMLQTLIESKSERAELQHVAAQLSQKLKELKNDN